jgi:hypothetical protein
MPVGLAEPPPVDRLSVGQDRSISPHGAIGTSRVCTEPPPQRECDSRTEQVLPSSIDSTPLQIDEDVSHMSASSHTRSSDASEVSLPAPGGGKDTETIPETPHGLSRDLCLHPHPTESKGMSCPTSRGEDPLSPREDGSEDAETHQEIHPAAALPEETRQHRDCPESRENASSEREIFTVEECPR